MSSLMPVMSANFRRCQLRTFSEERLAHTKKHIMSTQPTLTHLYLNYIVFETGNITSYLLKMVVALNLTSWAGY